MKGTIFAAIVALVPIVSAQQSPYGQCGGIGWTGPTTCTSGWTCVYSNDWYSQCIQCSTCTAAGTTAAGTTAAGTTTTTRSTTSTTTSRTTSTTGSTSTGGTVPVDGLFGYGAGTTGGGSATAVTVTSCSALKSAVSGTSSKVVRLNAMLSGCGIIDIGSNTSVLGVGSNSGFSSGSGFRVINSSNVIIRNLKLGPPPSAGDVIQLQVSTKIWVDHCELYCLGLTGGKDDYDGLLDATHAADYITVSWCKFHDHWKASLIGHSDSNASEDTGKLRITYHHNSWININSRTPSLRFGTGHIYNSYFSGVPTSGINSRMGAQVRVENNVFNSVTLAMVTDLDSSSAGYICNVNNVLTSSTTRITQTCSLSIPYSYSLDATSVVQSRVTQYAGVGVITF